MRFGAEGEVQRSSATHSAKGTSLDIGFRRTRRHFCARPSPVSRVLLPTCHAPLRLQWNGRSISAPYAVVPITEREKYDLPAFLAAARALSVIHALEG
jgi:hypothetical protein